MIAGISTTVSSQTEVTSTTVTGTGVVIDHQKGSCLVFRLSSANNSGTTPTLDVKIQHAPTVDGVYTDLLTFNQAGTGTSELEVQLPTATMAVLPCVRAVGTLGGTTPNYSYTVKCFSN